MSNLEELYQDCRSYIGMRPVGMTSEESLTLYAFVEQYAISTKVPQELIDEAQRVVDKYQKFQIQV